MLACTSLQAPARLLHAQVKHSIICTSGCPTATRRRTAVSSSFSQAAVLQSDMAAGHHPQLQHHLQITQHPRGLQQQLHQTIHSCNNFEQLLFVIQQHGRALSADDITSLLYRGAMLAKSAKRLHGINAAAKRARNSSKGASSGGSSPYTVQDVSRAQQLVSLCLQRLLNLSQQVTAQHLSNCLLSLAALCSRGGPATAAFAGSSSTKQWQHADDTHGHKQRQQQQPERGGGLLQQLVTPASSRALEQLLVAAAPQHQLQQLLDLTCSSSSRGCLAHAEFHQLVNTVYSLAVLPLRPAPHVLQELLQHTQHHMQQLVITQTSDTKHHHQQQQCRVPRLLSQLLWSAATLQIQLPASWLDSFWCASSQLLLWFSAQDVANTIWAAAALRLEPPAAWLSGLMVQITSVSGHMTGQGLANTLWGLAVMNPAAVDVDMLLHILQSSVQAAKQGNIDRQNLANIFWSVAKCRGVIGYSSSSACRVAVLQQLQQLLCFSSSILPSLQPRDWAELLWSCGQLDLSPPSSVLQQLWRRTPAGFHTSLNPHSLVINGSSNSSRSLGGPAWSPQALSMCLAGCARIRAQPTAIWLQGFEVSSVSLLPVFSTQLLANTLWALGQLRYRPSDTWMTHYWQQADRIVIRLQQAAATVAQSDQSTAWQQQLEVAAAAAEVVMVVQAAGRLHILPPLTWLVQALAAVTAVVTQANLHQQVQPQQVHSIMQLKTLTAFIHALSRLLHNASRVSSSDRGSSCIAVADVELLLKHAVQPHTTSSSSSSLLPVHLSPMDTLLLLSAVSLLPHSSTAAAADVVVPLLAHCWQLLALHSNNNSSSTTWSGRQLVQVAVSVARVLSHVTRSPVSSSSSRQRRVVAQQLWANVVDPLQRAGSSSSRNTASGFVPILCDQLEQHLSHLAPADISKCLVAVAKLNSSSDSSSSSSVLSFTAAAGQAVSTHMAVMSPHQRVAAAASLAQLGYCPSAAWLELLLLHSSCQFSGDACSSRSMLLLLQSMPVLLRNHQLQQQQQHQLAAAAAVNNCTQVPATAVVGWLRDWLGESSIRMSGYTSSQLVATAAALQKLLSCLQQQQQQQVQVTAATDARQQWRWQHSISKEQQQLQLPSAWRSAFLCAVQQHLPMMSAAELVSLISFAYRLQLGPSHEWCAAVADEAAARAAVTAGLQRQQQDGTTSSIQLKVHHVGLLAHTFKQLAYRPPWPVRQVLLDAVLVQCRVPDSGSARPTALSQLIRLLSVSGWYPSRRWIRYFKRSRAVRQLRLYLSKKRHRGSWRQLERRLRSWEQLAADRQHG